jgi:hypothetical protein
VFFALRLSTRKRTALEEFRDMFDAETTRSSSPFIVSLRFFLGHADIDSQRHCFVLLAF